MPTHPDAVGHLNDLATEINEPWFKMVCDLVTLSGVSVLDEPTLDLLFALYTRSASYIGIKPAPATAVASTPVSPADNLEHLSGFTNFKLLGNELKVTFKKRITLIFGATGSGKSSLCESLKVLATSELPIRPLQNVRNAATTSPAFRYKFISDATEQTWTPSVGYGSRRSTVKYFDTAIALGNVKNPVEPGRVIVLTPFRLHVFEWAKTLTTQFREGLQQALYNNEVELTEALDAIRGEFVKFEGFPLATIDDKTLAILPAQIKLGEAFKDQELLTEKQATAAEFEKATSEEGLKLVRAEHRELETFLTSLSTLLTSASGLWEFEPWIKAKTLAAKQVEQEVLARALIPKDGTLDDLLAMLRTVSPICKMDAAEGHACPLCKRNLGVPEVELFKRYHHLLAGQLEKDITVLNGDLTHAAEFATAVVNVDREAWGKYTTIQTEVLTTAMSESGVIIASCEVSKEPTVEAKAALESLKEAAAEWGAQLESKKNAIETATKGRGELVNKLATLRSEIKQLEYEQAIFQCLEKLREAQRIADIGISWVAKIRTFTQLLKRITKKAKDAHEQLVVIDFEARLDAEYKALAEKDMSAFGVRLARKGTDAAVTMLPQIGGENIEGVLSEGEQRVHALALFFAELESCPESVLVFDDPISSFYYNYIANYCMRLRDFALKYPSRQIIVLTHNWEFFVQLQTVLNKACLGSHLSVQVLENCAVVADYSEKIDDLKIDIEVVLATPDEPSKAKKEETAGKMRRLIEAVVNAHVFNHQRHQYKQKSQVITAFHSFTKVVALLPAEATKLGDLYAKLSISEHDDLRNAYVNSDKAMFQTRYDQIIAIETAIKARIP